MLSIYGRRKKVSKRREGREVAGHALGMRGNNMVTLLRVIHHFATVPLPDHDPRSEACSLLRLGVACVSRGKYAVEASGYEEEI